ncbi:hypothetical protein YPPY103_0710, partial [Yersinia pestis PY-103]
MTKKHLLGQSYKDQYISLLPIFFLHSNPALI